MGPLGVPLLSGDAYQAESLVAFAAMTTQPGVGMKRLYNRCIASLKGAGIWSKLDALYLMNVHDAQAARLNLKQPGTYNLTAVSSPTFTANQGYTGNGSSAELDTNFNPTTASSPNYVRDSGSAFAWSLKQGQDAGGVFGQSSLSTTLIYPRFTDDKAYIRANDGTDGTVASTDGRGLWQANRSASGARQGYWNGAAASFTGGTTASTAMFNGTFRLLRDQSGFFSGAVAMAGFGSSLSASEAASLYTALAAFKAGVEAL